MEKAIYTLEEMEERPPLEIGDDIWYEDIGKKGSGKIESAYYVAPDSDDDYRKDGMRCGWWYELTSGVHVSDPFAIKTTETEEQENGVEETGPMDVGGFIKWLSLLRDDGVILKPDGSPFSPLDDMKIEWRTNNRLGE